ncbi:alpha-glucuronidase family glycosyl hydrolase [Asticcacaulis sp. 201]|uniref:alpha-glucuronidase family glycosyl hydrolase n=1 Tax=Asticcacaulis sp. 201 TaxID=3028787 RepID=UPI00291672A1|nr:alpha-glucuronidase family glycosyl hydrolase [Asticcacaulis sp. 201]MDV6332175.1 alpha-glucuronidase family glycosyl hydrolase [Asticcacaulis sp. 201]
MRHWSHRWIAVARIAITCIAIAAAASPLLTKPARAEDGYDLWLRYRPVETSYAAQYRPHATAIIGGNTPILMRAKAELQRGLDGLLDQKTPIVDLPVDGAVMLVTEDASVPEEGFRIEARTVNGHAVTVISARTDQGALYGAFRFLRQIQTRQSLDHLKIADAPKIKLRVVDHWDNLNGTVERGYSGASIFDWWRLPDLVDPRLTDYARAEASIGINGVVLNNVNAKADSLTEPYLRKTEAVAQVLRPYGIKVYLSARFSAPIDLGGLKTADPLDPAVQAWWAAKTDEIYKIIPDFGGFLVKANSEGQPGPGDYGRNHAQGANMLAAALKPHGGIVMWRAFVYSEHDADDRAKQAYNEFAPVEGQFADNVLLQIKNGPIDFQPREPFHPLFGAMPKTNEMLEVQVTKEYLGQGTHLVYQGPLYEETLKADTFAKGKGSTVAKIIDGSLDGHTLTGIAGVSNVGDDRNWTAHDFSQADWYAFGRLAWDPEASSRDIAADWVRMTFSADPAFVKPVVEMMMTSRETAARYMTPLGLAHQMATGHHYGPGPWVCDLARPEWNPCYYAKADARGIGFDRTATGSNALAQYTPKAAKLWTDPKTMDERYLLWFHHLPWTYKVQSGRSLWDELVTDYDAGANAAGDMRRTWAGLSAYVDPQRFAAISANLAIQEREARWWRDASIAYFQSKSGLPLPAGIAAPTHDLDYYKGLNFPYAPGHN